jgi:hypothetical protein
MVTHLGWRRDIPPAETSIALQLVDFDPLLNRLHALFDGGVAAAQVHEIVGHAESMDLDDEWDHTYCVQFRGRPVDLRIRIVMEQQNRPTLYFYGPPLLIELIANVMEQFEADTEL